MSSPVGYPAESVGTLCIFPLNFHAINKYAFFSLPLSYSDSSSSRYIVCSFLSTNYSFCARTFLTHNKDKTEMRTGYPY